MFVVNAVDFAEERQFVQREVEEEEDSVIDEDAGRELEDELPARGWEKRQRTLRLEWGG